MLAATHSGRNLPANGEITKREDQFLSPRIVAREAAKIMAAKGIEIRPAALRRLVTRFIRHGHTTLAELESLVVAYADPTGETATAHVMRERGY